MEGKKIFCMCTVLLFLISINVTLVKGSQTGDDIMVADCDEGFSECIGDLYILMPPWDFYVTNHRIFKQTGSTQYWIDYESQVYDTDATDGFVYFEAITQSGEFLASAWFGHFARWECPRSGQYTLTFQYSYDGWSYGQYAIGDFNAAKIIYRFQSTKKEQDIFGMTGEHYNVNFKGPTNYEMDVYCIKGETYEIGANFTLLISHTHAGANGGIQSWGKLTRITLEPLNKAPNKPNRPVGPTEGKIRKTHTYYTTTTDPEEDNVYYKWDWGDGTFSDWQGPYTSGENADIAHTWSDKGTYEIKVIAKDDPNGDGDLSDGLESEWSEQLVVTMPKNKSLTINILIQNFLQFLKDRFSLLITLLS